MNGWILGIDVGGTRIKAGGVDTNGRVIDPQCLASPRMDPETLERTVVSCAQRVMAGIPSLPQCVGLSLSGGVDPVHGVVRLPGKFFGLEGYPLVPRLRDALGMPVWADNDGRMALYAEMAYGHLRDCRWGIMLTIGTGVGSGVLLDGRILRDPGLMFGTQAGHLIIDARADAPLCLTGARGTAEQSCSATALELAVAHARQRGLSCSLGGTADFMAIVAAARDGDPLCQDELARWREKLGLFLIACAHAYAPERIVLGGGAMGAADVLLPRLQAIVDQHAFVHPASRRIPICISRMPDHAGLIGAALFARENLEASHAH